jgi:hypothetical protein
LHAHFSSISKDIYTKRCRVTISMKPLIRYIGNPPKCLLSIKANDKYLFQAQCVGQWWWIEIAAWRTRKSALKGWDLTWKKLITPWVGMAYFIDFRSSG